jgi:hypothetical protein
MAGKVIILPMTVKEIFGSNNFNIDLYNKYDSDIVFVRINNGREVVKTKNKIYVKSLAFNKSDGYDCKPGVDAVFSIPDQNPVLVKLDGNELKFKNLKTNEYLTSFTGTNMMVVDDIIYLKQDNKLYEIEIKDLFGKVIPSIRKTWQIMPNSSQFLQNFIYQTMLGKLYLTIPNPDNIACPQLDRYKIIDGKYDSKLCIIYASKHGIISKFIIRLSNEYTILDVNVTENVDLIPINFVTLTTGVSVSIIDDGVISVLSKDNILKINDNTITISMMLCKSNNQAMFSKDNKLFKISMKK